MHVELAVKDSVLLGLTHSLHPPEANVLDLCIHECLQLPIPHLHGQVQILLVS